MSPNTLSIVTTDRINRTLRLTQLMMTQYNNISVPDPLNPNEDWKPTKDGIAIKMDFDNTRELFNALVEILSISEVKDVLSTHFRETLDNIYQK